MSGLEFNASPLWIAVVVLLAGGLSYWLYRRTADTLPRGARWFLTLFRFVMLCIAGLLFLEPRYQSKQNIESPPVVAILMDDSESLIIQRDSGYVRKEFPPLLKSFTSDLSSGDAKADLYTFGTATRTGSADSLTFAQEGTNIASAFDDIRRIYSGQNLGAVVLITDGITTAGNNPLYAIDHLNVPVFVAMLGDTVPQKDIRITEVLVNEIAYLDNETPVKVRVNADGYDNQPLQVSLMHQGKVLSTQNVTINAGQNAAEADFLIKPDQTGLLQYNISVTALPDEVTHRNNSRSVYINVLETKVKIALYAGFPHPDVSALRTTLLSDKRFSLFEGIHKTQRDFYPGEPQIPLGECDLIILHNFPFSVADAPAVEKIRQEAEKRKVPLLVFVGQYTDLKTLSPLFDFMGLSPQVSSTASEEAQIRFTEDYSQHSTYNFSEGWLRLMNTAPPLYRNRSEWVAKGDTRVFGTATIKGVTLDYPVYGLQSHLGHKNMVFVGEGFWRIKSHVSAEAGDFEAFDTWIYNNIQWLMVREDKRKFRVTPSKQLYSGSEPVLLKGQVYDDSYNPLPGVNIRVNLKGPDGKENVLYMVEPGSARYSLELNNLAEGTYEYTAEGMKNDVKVGSDRGQFSIGKSSIEHYRLTADFGMLRQLALRSGGSAVVGRDLASLKDQILGLNTMKPVVSVKKSRLGFQEFTTIFFVMLALLTVEWIVRKRYSMI